VPDTANTVKPQHDGFIIVPRYVKARCDSPFEVDLWATIKDIAGENGVCHLPTDDLAVLADMSAGQASKARVALLEKKLIVGELKRDPGFPQAVWHLGIPDSLWSRNAEFCLQNRSLRERILAKRLQRESLHVVKTLEKVRESSPHEEGVTPHEEGVTPHELKKIPKADFQSRVDITAPKKIEAAWDYVKNLLQAEMLRREFSQYVEMTAVLSFDAAKMILIIFAGSADAAEWLESRLKSTVERMLVGILNLEVVVEFVAAETSTGESE